MLAAPILVGLVLLGTTEREPLVRASNAVASEEKRRLYGLLRGKNPKTRVDLMASRTARVSVTLPFVTPMGRSRYLNVVAEAACRSTKAG